MSLSGKAAACLYKYKTQIIQLLGRGQIYHNLWIESLQGLCCDVHCVVSIQESVCYVRGSYITIIIGNICNRNKHGNENICLGMYTLYCQVVVHYTI